jgi:hypothetical protein
MCASDEKRPSIDPPPPARQQSASGWTKRNTRPRFIPGRGPRSPRSTWTSPSILTRTRAIAAAEPLDFNVVVRCANQVHACWHSGLVNLVAIPVAELERGSAPIAVNDHTDRLPSSSFYFPAAFALPPSSVTQPDVHPCFKGLLFPFAWPPLPVVGPAKRLFLNGLKLVI